MTLKVQSPARNKARQLLAGLSLSGDELRRRLEQAADPAYWQALYPPFSVCAPAPPMPDLPPLDAAVLDRYTRGLDQYGYFCSQAPLVERLTAPLLECIDTLRKAGWPPAFAYVYDQLWTLWQIAPIAQILGATLGPGYQWIPHGWCHYVQPVRGASGWPPHVDGDLPNRMSIWIPLTDATIDNGCIYLVPKDMNPSAIGSRRELRAASNLQMRELLQRGRALPAPAGSLLGWHFRILHWGSTAHSPGNPRVSLVLEFIAANEPPISNEMPLYDPAAPLPDLTLRLHSIGRAIRQYMRYELKMRRYAELAAALMNLGSASA
ncbi:MAG TPA: phytanoyl-CoA dioxygenase family protein [Candidatus Binataceae bacterium]|nr:phytanoyl-CoA dioxygenase family protein [Candidatus Binataceae bacterium]